MDVINRDQDVAIRDHLGKMASTGKSHSQTPVGKTKKQKVINRDQDVAIRDHLGKMASTGKSHGQTPVGKTKKQKVINRDQDVAIRDHLGKMASTGKSHGQTPVGKTKKQKATNERRIVILGKTGSGKSSIGNTIFGEDKFRVCHKSISALCPCQAKTKLLNGGEITLIDTPGFFDTDKLEDELKPEITKCITECSPGPHAFLILLKLERFTKQENDVIKQITQYFSEEVFKFTTVVFTHGDDLPEGWEIKDYVRDNQCLSDLVEKCGGRCNVIDNKYWKNPSDDPYRSNTHQVEEILKSVEEIVKGNNGNYYTNEMLEKVEEMIQQEEERIAQSSRNSSREETLQISLRTLSRSLPGLEEEEKCIALSSENMSREEIRQKAKSIVCDILNKAVGITTGALLGAFFGVVAKIVDVVKNPAAGQATAAGVTERGGGTITDEAVIGALTGFLAAKEAETPCETINKTIEALDSRGKDVGKKS